MNKLSKRERAVIDARIQRAVAGLLINMMDIPRIYRAAEASITSGADDITLRRVVCDMVREINGMVAS